MAKGQRILALDIGAATIKLAEFITTRDGSVELVNFGVSALGSDAVSDLERLAIISTTIKELMTECQIKPGTVLVSVSGQSVFSRFVKLPPVDKDKVYQIISYEAQQNVPFPINEVVWDYQLIGRGEGELDVMLAAIKADIIIGLTESVDMAGLNVDMVDVAPMALYNAVRYNYGDAQGCTLVVDIGSRSTDLIFMEESRVFIRSVPVAGNAITQQIMREFELSHDEAEEMKFAHAYVSLGGVYEEPKGEIESKVAKIVRNVMTRMHAEIDRSIKFYRTQQGGSQPALVLLAGGSSTIPSLEQFLHEKLKVEIASLNPFINVPVSSSIDTGYIGKHAHELAQVVGLALRKSLACPIEINLLPPNVVQEKRFKRRQPVLVAAAATLVVTAGLWAAFYAKMSARADDNRALVLREYNKLEQVERPLRAVEQEIAAAQGRFDALRGIVENRGRLPRVLAEIKQAMPPDLWLVEVKTVRVTADEATENRDLLAGSVKGLTIRGMGYIDKVASPEVIRNFRDQLRASPMFSDATEFASLPTPPPGIYTREFTLNVALEVPLAP